MIPLLLQHLPIVPVAAPLFAGALLLLLPDARRRLKTGVNLLSLLVQLAAALTLIALTTGGIASNWPSGVGVYLLGDWPAPFGIVVVVDRLSAAMLLLTALLGCSAWVYATARWERAGVHFDPLFQFLLMGLNGAFLTGDLFNLFVFFEVLLAASYGLVLHGSGGQRVAAGLHYIAVNLIASFLLLIGIGLIYGVTGTLNMADLALRAGALDGINRHLFHAAAAVLAVAFLIKAAAWPLNFWLPAAYGNAAAPVGAIFAIMTKVGIYALMRLGWLLVGPFGASTDMFGGAWMLYVGIATLVFGGVGMLATQQSERLAGYAVIMSSGTLLAALGMPGASLTGPALFYLTVSVLTMGAFFPLLEMVERTQTFGADLLAVSLEAFDLDDPEAPDRSDDVVGVSIPTAMAFLGMSFVACALLITGLPPMSGFVAKFSLLSAAVQAATTDSLHAWVLITAVLLSGLAGIIALCRTGIRLFWNVDEIIVPKLKPSEAAPVAVLLLACVALSFWAGAVIQYFDDTARYLSNPSTYVDAVLRQDPLQRMQHVGQQP